MPIQQVVYVSVPVRHAYNGWTEYKQWPRYMHRANQVDAQISDQEARVKVTEKMWGFKRPFTAEIVTQCPDQQIKWNSTEGAKHTGVINFHQLGPRLTLVEVNLDHSPSGPVEKFARGARFVKRAVRADLHRFQGWIEMKSGDELEELEGWRGTIEGGRVVKSHDDALYEEPRDNGDEYVEEPEDEYGVEPASEYDVEPEDEYGVEPASEYDVEPEDEYGEEPADEYAEEPEADAGEQDEEVVMPRPRQPRRRTRQHSRQPAARPHQNGRA
jgi:hypothetical protein